MRFYNMRLQNLLDILVSKIHPYLIQKSVRYFFFENCFLHIFVRFGRLVKTNQYYGYQVCFIRQIGRQVGRYDIITLYAALEPRIYIKPCKRIALPFLAKMFSQEFLFLLISNSVSGKQTYECYIYLLHCSKLGLVFVERMDLIKYSDNRTINTSTIQNLAQFKRLKIGSLNQNYQIFRSFFQKIVGPEHQGLQRFHCITYLAHFQIQVLNSGLN
eukprot:TRINITY_DN29864_c0_g2_i2.p3 TRINITY_DN29864_c0_g2~~TRINITY_DN29864_c0_g2_i2.p3  ORF type:complete len:215 (-),score=-18.42 TRINITY_DN29864_c0_g2_i2:664-1308(-)